MKIAGLTISRAPAQAPPQGASGTSSPYGTLYKDLLHGSIDSNPLFHGPNRFLIYDEMRRTNPAVRSSLWMFKLPIRSAMWDFEPVSEDALDVLVADACRWQFGLGDEEGQLDRSWDEQLTQALLMFDWGAQFEEDVWRREPQTFIDSDGDPHVFWTLSRCEQRAPASLHRVTKDDETGLIASLYQLLPGTEPIDGSKVSAYVMDREGDDWLGNSILRPMWGPWRLQAALMAAAGVSWEHFGTKTPAVFVAAGQKQEGHKWGQDYVDNQRGYFVFEDSGASPRPVPRMEMMGPESPGDPAPLLNTYSSMIAMAGLQQFASLGTSQHGSRAVGDVLVEPFTMACVTIAKQVAAVKHRGAVRRFVDYNFGLQVPAPKLTASKVQMRGLDVLTAAIADLAAAGLEFTDLDTQNDLRSQLHLPMLPDDFQVGVAPAGQGTEGGLSMSDAANLAASQGAPAGA